MPSLRRVALVLGSLLLSGLAFAQGKLGPHIVDSNGQRVGYMSSMSSGVPAAVVSIDGETCLIPIARNGFLTSDVILYIQNADCTGQQYVRFGDPGVDLLARAWFTTDGVFHYISAAQVGEVMTLGTRTLHGDGSVSDCSSAPGDSLYAAPHLTAQAPTFTPPFLVVDAFPVSPAPGSATFNDVPTTHPFFQFIEALHAAGITGGCQAAPPLYCPDSPVTRGQMAVFMAKALGL